LSDNHQYCRYQNFLQNQNNKKEDCEIVKLSGHMLLESVYQTYRKLLGGSLAELLK
jgi:hypothetical protein